MTVLTTKTPFRHVVGVDHPIPEALALRTSISSCLDAGINLAATAFLEINTIFDPMPQAESNAPVNNPDSMCVRTSSTTDLPLTGFSDGTTVHASA